MAEKYLIKIMIAGTILFLIFVSFIAGYLYLYYRKQHLHVAEKEKMRHQHEKDLMSARLEEQERIMNQLSRDIHDNVAQKLDLLQMNHKGLVQAGYPEHLARYIEHNTVLYSYLATDLRNISYALNSDHIRFRGLVEVIRTELEYIEQTRQLRCVLNIRGQHRTMAQELELLAYRILQEASHNVIKHAQAGILTVQLEYEAPGFRMCISDDGIGFDPAAEPYQIGLGFRNMKARAALAKGQLNIFAKPGAGCTICLLLPPITPDP